MAPPPEHPFNPLISFETKCGCCCCCLSARSVCFLGDVKHQQLKSELCLTELDQWTFVICEVMMRSW